MRINRKKKKNKGGQTGTECQQEWKRTRKGENKNRRDRTYRFLLVDLGIFDLLVEAIDLVLGVLQVLLIFLLLLKHVLQTPFCLLSILRVLRVTSGLVVQVDLQFSNLVKKSKWEGILKAKPTRLRNCISEQNGNRNNITVVVSLIHSLNLSLDSDDDFRHGCRNVSHF